MKTIAGISILLFLISCTSNVSKPDQSFSKDTVAIGTSKNQVDSLKGKVSCDSLLNLLGRSSSYNQSMKLNYEANGFDSGILFIQVSLYDSADERDIIFGNLNLNIKNGLLTTIDPKDDTKEDTLIYNITIFKMLIKNCQFYQTNDSGTFVPNDSVKYIK